MKKISILGSTGSIGRQTLQVAEQLGYGVCALAADRNAELMEQQARRFSPELVAMKNEAAARELARRLSGTKAHARILKYKLHIGAAKLSSECVFGNGWDRTGAHVP